MNTRTKILTGALIGLAGLSVYQRRVIIKFSNALEKFEERLFKLGDRKERSITQSLCEAMAYMHNEDHATSMKDVAKPEEFADDAKRLLDALLEVSRERRATVETP